MKLKSWLKELPYTLLQGSLETEVDEVVYDSRKAAPGTVFVCMRGANVDSHTFIPDVVEKGAPVLVVEHPVEAPENVSFKWRMDGTRYRFFRRHVLIIRRGR